MEVNNKLVPWSHQVCNSNPSALQWTPACQAISVALPGLYEVTAGFFFSLEPPSVQLVVNEEVVLCGSTCPVKGNGAHSNVSVSTQGRDSMVVGCTLQDFISLPPNATVGVLFNGSVEAEGFIGLRKI